MEDHVVKTHHIRTMLESANWKAVQVERLGDAPESQAKLLLAAAVEARHAAAELEDEYVRLTMPDVHMA